MEVSALVGRVGEPAQQVRWQADQRVVLEANIGSESRLRPTTSPHWCSRDGSTLGCRLSVTCSTRQNREIWLPSTSLWLVAGWPSGAERRGRLAQPTASRRSRVRVEVWLGVSPGPSSMGCPASAEHTDDVVGIVEPNPLEIAMALEAEAAEHRLALFVPPVVGRLGLIPQLARP